MYETESDTIQNYVQRLNELRACLNIDATNAQIAELESRMSAPNFWDDPESAQKVVQQLKGLKSIVGAPDELQAELDDAAVLIEMAQEEEDEAYQEEIAELLEKLEKRLSRLELNSLFMDPRDSKPALLSVHPGAGGT